MNYELGYELGKKVFHWACKKFITSSRSLSEKLSSALIRESGFHDFGGLGSV